MVKKKHAKITAKTQIMQSTYYDFQVKLLSSCNSLQTASEHRRLTVSEEDSQGQTQHKWKKFVHFNLFFFLMTQYV